MVERYTYDPYGRTLIEKCNQSTDLPVERLTASRFGNPFAWTGQRYDAGVKLYHFLHRSQREVLSCSTPDGIKGGFTALLQDELAGLVVLNA